MTGSGFVLVRLALVQIPFVTGSFLLVWVALLLAQPLAPAVWGGLPLALLMAGTWAASSPAAAISRRWGSKRGTVLGVFLGVAGASGVVAALSLGSFPLLCAAYFVYGLHRACLVSLDALASGALSSRGPSVLLIGTLAGAILGPALGYWGRGGTIPFAASFGLLLGGMAVQAVVAATLPDVRREETSRIGLSHRPWGQRLADPALWLAAGAPALSSGLVVLFLAVLPLAMREHGHPLSSSTLVLQAFGLGVCASRVISSRLWKRWEARRLMAWGIVLFAAASLTSWAGTDLWPFAVALTLLGFGWNLLLVGGASLLAKVHRPTENTGVQVFRDSLVYGFAAVASLGAGLGERTLGWSGLQLLTIPILGVLVVLLLVNRSPKKPVDS